MALPRDIVTGDYYHVYNRGAFKNGIHRDRADYMRFLCGVIAFQSPVQFPQVGRIARTFSDADGFDIPEDSFGHILESRTVELVSFCILGNHFHLIVRELVEGGLMRYMQRIELAYTKYFNTRYGVSGHVYEGRYKAKHIGDNEYLMHLSAYIHRNPRELRVWKGREAEYPWSSYRDYVKENRWGGLLAQEIILDQFDGTKESNYADFIKTSPAKELDFD